MRLLGILWVEVKSFPCSVKIYFTTHGPMRRIISKYPTPGFHR